MTLHINPRGYLRRTHPFTKATDEEVRAAYKATGSVWKAGKLLGMAGQSVHERATKLGIIRGGKFTKDELQKITALYSDGFQSGDGLLKSLSKELARTIPSISKKAGELGLSDTTRTITREAAAATGKRTMEHIKQNGHPRGMLGKKHTEATKRDIGQKSKVAWASMTEDEQAAKTMKMLKTKAARGNLAQPRPNATWKAGWRTVAGRRCYFRSRWEANYGAYLQFLKEHNEIEEWEYEPKTFWFEAIKRGVRSYLPDFRVTENGGRQVYHEVKGWMDARSKTKLKRMAKYYPEIELILIQAPWFKANTPILRGVVKGWET